MHVVQINFFPAPAGSTAAEVLDLWPSLAVGAEVVATAGTRVTVIQVAAHGEQVTREGIDYHFVDVAGATSAVDRGRRVASVLRSMDADVLHVHGLGFAQHAFAISQMEPTLPILLQDHADHVPRWWRRVGWHRWYRAVSGVSFTAPELAQPFVASGVFDSRMRLFAIPESSSRFTRGSRSQARAETGLHGDPCVLWVGHLSSGKDPLTVLDGIAEAAEQLPDLQLWCAFGSAPLLRMVQQRVASDPRLRDRVHLLGRVAHAEVESLMRAADVFVSGSHAESCGYAVLEAMACGVTPVVTDIPSFRATTGNIGLLWPRGDPKALADALVRAALGRPSPERVRAHFDAALSFDAIGRRWADAYMQLIDGSTRRAS